jgi:hypothetical protein
LQVPQSPDTQEVATVILLALSAAAMLQSRRTLMRAPMLAIPTVAEQLGHTDHLAARLFDAS